MLIPLSSFVSSCGNGCEDTRESFCFAELLSSSGASINTLYAYGIGQGKGKPDSTGVKTDSIMFTANSPKTLEFILNPNKSVSDIRLQITYTLDGDKFQLEDTLHFEYESHPHLLDMDCGCTMYFDLSTVTCTKHLLRDVTIIKNAITNEESLNIRIEY